MKQGDIIKINGVDLLVLDMINGKPFVLAYNLDITTNFSNINNDYDHSILRDKVEQWFKDNNFTVIPRIVDLSTVSGDIPHNIKTYYAKVAPLTFDEYRKYNKIIKPHINHGFWTATAWSSNSNNVCYIASNGTADYYAYNGYICRGLAPAFILDVEAIKQQIDLSTVSIEALMNEINKRLKER